jgi:hypothetical protein
MMRWIKKIKFHIWLLWRSLSLAKFVRDILSVFGILWLIVEIVAFFGKNEISQKIQSLWWLFILVGVIGIIYRCWPKYFFSYKVHNRDVNISIMIGDILQSDGAVIVPINNQLGSFDKGNIMRANSILRHFIEKMYNKTPSHLQTDIKKELECQKDWYEGFRKKKEGKEFKIGTVVPVLRDEKQYYLLCNSTLNEQGRAKSTEDDLYNALTELWSFLSQNGSKDNLLMPLIGTGRGRITLKREEVIKEIVLSFLASLSQENYCEQLIICIHPYDFKKHKIELESILNFIKLHCENTNFITSRGKHTEVLMGKGVS